MGIHNVDSLVAQYETEYTKALDLAKAKAAEQGCGVMTVGQTEIFVCEYVPVGRVYQAGNKEAYDKFLKERAANA